MGTKDILTLFKISILKGGWLLFFALIWFLVFSYIPFIIKFIPQDFLNALEHFSKYLPDEKSWLVPFSILVPIVWILTFVLLKELVERFIDYTKRGTFYNLTVQSWYKDWIYNGKSKMILDPVRLRVNSSRAGCLLKKYLWKDFKMNFHMKFFNLEEDDIKFNYGDPCVGVVFRAVNLENYFMLEIRKRAVKVKIENKETEEHQITIKPHVRYFGMWETMSEEFIKKIDIDPGWFKVDLIVRDKDIILSLENIGDYKWFLPTHVDINHIEDGIRKNNNSGSEPENKSDVDFATKTQLLPEIEFKEAFGMIGFRAHLDQGADIKELTIKSI